MPLAFLSTEGGGRFVPLAPERFCLGSDPRRDLVESAKGIAPRHADVRYVKGEYLISGSGGALVEVNGSVVPFIALRDGDRVRLSRDGRTWQFRNRMEGSFRPPGASLAGAWFAHPDFARTAHGPERFGDGVGVGGRDTNTCRRVASADGGAAWVVKRLAAIRSEDEADHFLHVLTAIGGSPHDALAHLVDGGLTPVAAGDPARWLATEWVEGVPAANVVGREDVSPEHLLRILHTLAAGLAHLHERGVVHRDVAPGNVVLRPDDGAVLIDFGHAVIERRGARPSRGVVGTPGYVPPEAVLSGPEASTAASDWYGWAAVGYALATGRSPAEGDDVLERLAGSTSAPPTPGELGAELPPILETVLMQALAVEPTARPDARAVLDALDYARTELDGLRGARS